MKKLLKISVLLVLIFTTGCDSPQINCETGPVIYTFEFVDKDSGANLFDNGTFPPQTPVTVTDLNQNKIIQTTYLKSNNSDRALLVLGFVEGTFKYAVNIGDKPAFELSVVTERVKGSQCSNIVKKATEIKNAEYQEEKTTGIYKILMNTKN
ncbi:MULTISPECIES: hypothetical protein [Flavobacterium]|uniref:Lipoprotein n=1 Tax=Flavobacterium ginsengisoli TaxID=871694 RepID=A0ABP7F302_9FLAO|nr:MULTISPECIES: hypothetical protein [Flavobacterium]MBJ2124743.1 hypothetical protein [Flavobacterium sp. IB48]